MSAISTGASRLWDWVRGRLRPLQRSLSGASSFFQRGSVAARLFWLSAGWLIVALVATGVLLTELYSRTLDQSLSETLEFYVEELVDLVLDSGDPAAEIRVPDPRFDRSASGWYWTIADADGNVVNLSPSAVGVVVPQVPGGYDDSNARQTIFTDSFGRRIRIFQRAVTVGGIPLTLTVTGDLDEILGVVDVFRGQTLIVLLTVAVALAIMSFIVARIAFRPLQKLSKAIERVREGETENIAGDYPSEVTPIADEVNELL